MKSENSRPALAAIRAHLSSSGLVLYFKHLMVLKGHPEFALHFNETDALTDSQRGFAETQLKLFDAWYAGWSKQPGAVQKYAA